MLSRVYFSALKGDVKVESLLHLLEAHNFSNNRMCMLDVLLSHWLSEEKLLDNYQDSVEMLHLHSLVAWMLVTGNESDPKLKWDFIRKTLQCSTNVTAALTAAIMIRGICISSSSISNHRAEPSNIDTFSCLSANQKQDMEYAAKVVHIVLLNIICLLHCRLIVSNK